MIPPSFAREYELAAQVAADIQQQIGPWLAEKQLRYDGIAGFAVRVARRGRSVIQSLSVIPFGREGFQVEAGTDGSEFLPEFVQIKVPLPVGQAMSWGHFRDALRQHGFDWDPERTLTD